MAQIKFYALGGLGDNGKNLYVLEINNKILILDAGLQHPSGDLLGVDAIVPYIGYLESRKEDCKKKEFLQSYESHRNRQYNC